MRYIDVYSRHILYNIDVNIVMNVLTKIKWNSDLKISLQTSFSLGI